MTVEVVVKAKFLALSPLVDDHFKQLWAALEARSIGRGGLAIVSRATGLSVNTIKKAMIEFSEEKPREKRFQAGKQKPGRKKLITKDKTLLIDLKNLVESTTKKDPTPPLFWTCKSTSQLAKELTGLGHTIGPRTVAELLNGMNYRLENTRKTKKDKYHFNRSSQFEYISLQIKKFHLSNQPTIAVDTRKREISRDYQESNAIRDLEDYPMIASPFRFKEKKEEGWVKSGIDHDNAEFAVESIRLWWLQMGAAQYPKATRLLITADCGGTDEYRVRLWKTQLQKLANETKLTIAIHHFPPCTNKWNFIEHQMFCHIIMSWRGSHATNRELVINLIGNTIKHPEFKLDKRRYAKRITKEEMKAVRLTSDPFYSNWNYTISPSE